MKTIALSLTTLLMADSSTASAPPTMGSLAIQDAPLVGSLVLSDHTPVTNTILDGILQEIYAEEHNNKNGQSSFYWVYGNNKCADFELDSGDTPYVKKNCHIYQEGTCKSQGFTVFDGSQRGKPLGVFPCYLAGISRTLTVNYYEKASILDEILAETEAAVETFQAQKNIVALAAGDKDLSTLVAAVTEAHLVSALEGKGPFTVFAPTNEAFAKLPSGVLSKLLKPQNVGQLKSILTYHVVKGAVHAADLRDGEMVTTLEGQKLRVTINRAGDVFIDGAKVTTANVDASNGVVHIIDSVLLPPAQKWHGGLRSSW